MNAIRKILMPLLLIPLGMFLYVALYPDWQWEKPGLELIFAVIGIPILVINFIAWFYPEIIRGYFPVKEDWELGRDKSVTLAALLSTLIAFTFVSVGAVSAITDIRARPRLELSRAQPATATAFARSVQSVASATDSDESAIISTPRPSLEVSATPEGTLQIPVSGGISTNLPALTTPVAQTEAVSVSTQPSILNAPVISTSTISTPIPNTTNTAAPLGSCTPATQEYVDVVWQFVQDTDTNNNVTTGWMVQSNAEAGLWFVAAKIHKSGAVTEVTLPGVWALFVESGEVLDVYAINDVAMEFSDAPWGEDSEPVLSMQTDGAQAAYNCAAQAQ